MLSAPEPPATVRMPPVRVAANIWRDSSSSMKLGEMSERAGRRGAFITSPEKWAACANPCLTSWGPPPPDRPNHSANPLTLEFVRSLKRPQQFAERAFFQKFFGKYGVVFRCENFAERALRRAVS